ALHAGDPTGRDQAASGGVTTPTLAWLTRPGGSGPGTWPVRLQPGPRRTWPGFSSEPNAQRKGAGAIPLPVLSPGGAPAAPANPVGPGAPQEPLPSTRSKDPSVVTEPSRPTSWQVTCSAPLAPRTVMPTQFGFSVAYTSPTSRPPWMKSAA